MSWASASPEPLSDMLILMPVLRANTVWIMLHHSAWTEQITLICPLPWACAGRAAAAARARATGMAWRRVDTEEASSGMRVSPRR